MLLREAGGTAPAVAPATSERDEQILARLLSSDQPQWAERAAVLRRRRVTPVRVAVAALVVIAMVVAGVAWQSWQSSPADARTPALLHFSEADLETVLTGQGQPARQALLGLASDASAQPVVAGHGDQTVSSYGWYLDAAIDQNGTATTLLAPMFTTTVLRPDGSMSSHEARGRALDVHGNVIDGRYPPGGQVAGDDLPAGTFDANRAANLPRDPVALRNALITAFAGEGAKLDPGDEATLLIQATMDLYQREVISPDLAAALWTALADEPSIVRLGTTTDRLGRPGVAVAAPTGQVDAPGMLVLVISPKDGHLLEWDDVVATVPQLGIDQPAVIGFEAFLSSEWSSAS
ncbi:MAG TPA: hypothetical protein VGC04_03135 [Cellulomonas sp.]